MGNVPAKGIELNFQSTLKFCLCLFRRCEEKIKYKAQRQTATTTTTKAAQHEILKNFSSSNNNNNARNEINYRSAIQNVPSPTSSQGKEKKLKTGLSLVFQWLRKRQSVARGMKQTLWDFRATIVVVHAACYDLSACVMVCVCVWVF